MRDKTAVAMKSRPARRFLLPAAGALLLGASGMMLAVGSRPVESPAVMQDESRDPSRQAQGPAPGRRAEPAAARGMRHEAGSGPAAGRAAGGRSEAIDRMIESLQAEAVPREERFALVQVTDRRTGERRLLARGTISADLIRQVEDSSAAPAGEIFEEGDDVRAEGDVEVAVRYVTSHAGRALAALSARDEEEASLRLRNAGSGMSHRIEKELREALLSGRAGKGADDRIPVVITPTGVPRLRLPKIHDGAAAGQLWVGLEVAAARERAIIDRKQRMSARQAALIEAIERAGGTVRYAAWTSGDITALLPASRVAALAGHPEVFSLQYDEPQREASHRYRGDDYFVATDSEDYDQFHNGDTGLLDKHSYTSRVVLALGEKCIDQGNPAWLSSSSSTSTRGWFYDCDPSGACSQGGVESCSGSSRHGTRVAGLMTADFMDGQDAAVAAADRRIMTGTCPECRFFFLQDQGLNDRTKVLDAACDLGVDVFESSIGSIAQSCDGNGSYDSTLQSLIDCDAIYVQAAGNEGSGGGCSTVYPGDHPWTLTVGGMESEDPCNTSGAYYTSDCVYSPDASRGGADYSGDAVASVIDLAAPYRLGNLLDPLTSGPVTYGSGSGTSYATPIVAGLTAEFLDWWTTHVGDSLFYNNRARNFMMLFGDRSAGPSGTDRMTNDTSVLWGAGRVGLVPFDDKATWGIRRTSAGLGRNDSWSFTHDISAAATFYKAVVWHDGKDYSSQPMIRLSLNPSGCVNPTLSVDRLDSKVILVFTDLDGCDAIDVEVENVAVGFSGARRFHYAAYYDTEDERSF